MEQREWVKEYIETYLKCLPADLRPTDVSEKINKALALAYRNRWDAKILAHAVASNNYSTAKSPVGASIYRLEQLASQQAPRPGSPAPKFIPEPRRAPVPMEWISERIQLLNLIGNGLYETEEEASQAMRDLIESQTGKPFASDK